MLPFRLALSSTLLLLAVLMTLGLNLQLGRRPLCARRAHHLLYFLICMGTLTTGTLAGLDGRVRWPFLALFALLLGMSRTRPGRPAHWRLAGLISLLYAAVAWQLW